jgi:hypothetical protein
LAASGFEAVALLRKGVKFMAELIHKHSMIVKDDETVYIVRTYAEQRADRTWHAWLEFHPTDKSRPLLRTGQETSQPSRVTIEYWASGLTPVYLEGALTRAQGRLTPSESR